MRNWTVFPPRAGTGQSRPRLLRGFSLAIALTCGTTALAAQSPQARADLARTALNEGRLDEASNTLAALVADLPDDGGIRWLYAQVLRASGNSQEARVQFRRAVQLAPGDPWLRLEFGRFLVESGGGSEATGVLEPLRESPEAAVAGEAETLLGLGQYWGGNGAAAETHFRRALELDPGRREARTTLSAVRQQRATTFLSLTSYADDDQPLKTLRQAVEVSAALGGRVRGRIEASAQRHARVGPEESMFGAAAGLGVTLPGGKVRLDVQGGALHRGNNLGVMATGAGEVSVTVAADTHLRAGVGRLPYLWTVSSLDTALAATSLEFGVDRRAASGWAGEAGLRLERFPDDNVVRTVSGWLLAPVYVRPESGLRIGYAGAFQDARTSTYFAMSPSPTSLGPPGPPNLVLRGTYVPYFTPEEQQTHSLILEGRGGDLESTSLQITAVYAPWAKEQAPFLATGPGGVALPVVFFERTFTPWSLRAQLNSVASATTSLSISAEHSRTAFYQVNRIEASIAYRFLRSVPSLR